MVLLNWQAVCPGADEEWQDSIEFEARGQMVLTGMTDFVLFRIERPSVELN